jgi:hypothetical protein
MPFWNRKKKEIPLDDSNSELVGYVCDCEIRLSKEAKQQLEEDIPDPKERDKFLLDFMGKIYPYCYARRAVETGSK